MLWEISVRNYKIFQYIRKWKNDSVLVFATILEIRAWYGMKWKMKWKFRYGIRKMPEWNEMEVFQRFSIQKRQLPKSSRSSKSSGFIIA